MQTVATPNTETRRIEIPGGLRPEPTCKGCLIYKPGWCPLYGSIINDYSPVSACRRTKGSRS